MIRYEIWNKAITPELQDAFHDLNRAWTNWRPWILNYFDHPVTNAYTESLNSLIRVMNRLGRGYSFEALRAKMLFTEGAHKQSNIRPKFERLKDPDMEIRFSMAEGDEEDSDFVQDGEEPKNYGADINTLIRLIETGQI